MAIAILTQGKTAIRDALKTMVTHICVSTDDAAFAVGHTGINPTAGSTSTHVEASSEADVDASTFDSTITITGTTEFTGLSIMSIGLATGVGVRQATGAGGTHSGGSVVGTACVSRSVRSAGLGIGVQSGDTFTIGIRVAVADNS